MYFSMSCACEAMLEVDVPEGDESAGWMLILRFMNAHVPAATRCRCKSCG